MRTRMFAALVVIGLLAAAGCSSVSIRQPFVPTVPGVDQEKLSGVWQAGDGFLYVRFATNGVSRFAIPDWKEESFKVDQGDAITVRRGDNTYFCARLQKDGSWPEEYGFGQYSVHGDDTLLIWWPLAEPFKKAVEAGRLAGQSTTNGNRTLVLDMPPEKLLEFLEDADQSALFDYRNPAVFHRVATKAP